MRFLLCIISLVFFVAAHSTTQIGDHSSVTLEQSFGLNGAWHSRCDVSFEAVVGSGGSGGVINSILWRANATGAGIFDGDAAVEARAALDSDSFLRVRVVSQHTDGKFAVVGTVRMVSYENEEMVIGWLSSLQYYISIMNRCARSMCGCCCLLFHPFPTHQPHHPSPIPIFIVCTCYCSLET